MSEPITSDRLEELERKERAHDDYLLAIQETSQLAAKVELNARNGNNPYGRQIPEDPFWAFAVGYRAAIRAFNEALLQASQRRADADLEARIQKLEERLDTHLDVHESNAIWDPTEQ